MVHDSWRHHLRALAKLFFCESHSLYGKSFKLWISQRHIFLNHPINFMSVALRHATEIIDGALFRISYGARRSCVTENPREGLSLKSTETKLKEVSDSNESQHV